MEIWQLGYRRLEKKLQKFPTGNLDMTLLPRDSQKVITPRKLHSTDSAADSMDQAIIESKICSPDNCDTCMCTFGMHQCHRSMSTN